MKTLAQLYARASRQGVTVTNLRNITPEIYGCSLVLPDIGTDTTLGHTRWSYAQGRTPAQAMERAFETLERQK